MACVRQPGPGRGIPWPTKARRYRIAAAHSNACPPVGSPPRSALANSGWEVRQWRRPLDQGLAVGRSAPSSGVVICGAGDGGIGPEENESLAWAEVLVSALGNDQGRGAPVAARGAVWRQPRMARRVRSSFEEARPPFVRCRQRGPTGRAPWPARRTRPADSRASARISHTHHTREESHDILCACRAGQQGFPRGRGEQTRGDAFVEITLTPRSRHEITFSRSGPRGTWLQGLRGHALGAYSVWSVGEPGRSPCPGDIHQQLCRARARRP